MCNTSECITETLYVENDSKMALDTAVEKLSSDKKGITKKIDDGAYSRKNSSFKQACEFPIKLCRRGSKDIISWLNNIALSYKKSPFEILQHYFNQIQPSLFSILMCGVLLMISVQACICLFLLASVLLEPGFLFLFSSFVGVGVIGLIILTSKQANKPKQKIKSKEI